MDISTPIPVALLADEARKSAEYQKKQRFQVTINHINRMLLHTVKKKCDTLTIVLTEQEDSQHGDLTRLYMEAGYDISAKHCTITFNNLPQLPTHE